jgi:single-strand DNA-binding protein
MKSRSLNKVILIGNVVRQPEVRQTQNGSLITTFHIITNREWETTNGERKAESTKHTCVAWNRLAEICSDMLTKGTLVYIEGRLQVDNVQPLSPSSSMMEVQETKVAVDEMIVLNKKYYEGGYPNET